MSDSTNLSEARRILLEKMLRGNLPQTSNNTGTISRRSQVGPVPLSFTQQQFWLLNQMAPNTVANNQGLELRLPGHINVAALEQSLNEIIKRHEAWRTSFALVDGQPVQVIHPASALQLPVIDLRSLPEPEREVEALRLANDLVNRPFDLSKVPLIRVLLIRLRDAEYHLFLASHHIITDGFSEHQVLLPELHALYQAFSTGQPSPLRELDIQYADYALWQRGMLQGEVLEHLLLYWRQHLADASTELALPTDHPRPLAPSSRGAAYPFTLPKRLSDALRALSKQENTTLYMTLLAAFSTLLYRYSGQEDILIGTPDSGRARLEVGSLLGAFVNPLVLRNNLSGNPTFRDLLKRAREEVFAALGHADLPFEQLVRYLRPERATGQNPFIQVLLTLQPPAHPLPSGWSPRQMVLPNDLDRFDLSLNLEERAEGIIGSLEYNIDLFEAATIERMIGHWQTLLEGIVADPNQPITSLPLLTQAERQQLLGEWNATQADYPQNLCLPHLFEQQVEDSPGAAAVVFEDERLTYRQLNERANQLAHHLRKLGVGPETVVGLCVERSLEMLVGLLGILKAGGAYVPLDPTYPQERLAFMLEDTQAPVLLTQQRLLARLPAHQAQVLCLDTDWQAIDHESKTNLISGVQAHNLAYVIYTSGSTGKPKGVQIEHRSLTNYLHWVNKNVLGDQVRSLPAVTRLIFDASLKQVFAPLLQGREVWLLSEEAASQPARLLQALRQRKGVGLNCVPTLWSAMLDEMQSSPTLTPEENLTSLFVGGEQLSKELVNKSFAVLPQLQIWNLYGPTETTATSICARLVAEDTVPPIGRPIANTQVYLLDAHLQPVPIGVPGELYLGGVGLARGYLNRPELTAERFIPHPFSAQPEARLYKTGDLARYRPGGALEYLGRTDQQIKIRGFRIELGEIEAALSQHSAVRETVVAAREDERGNKRLVAYVALKPGLSLTFQEMRAFLKTSLPEYMLPSALVVLEALPLLPNGKLDRKALPAPEGNSAPDIADIVPPRTPTEMQLAHIWTELLDIEQIGITQNFFELGGHSLLAVRVLSRVNAAFQTTLLLPTLFEAPTIADLALKIVQQQADQIDDELTAQLLAELEQLSDDEAKSMLTIEEQVSRENG